jgi:hypothetical protein
VVNGKLVDTNERQVSEKQTGTDPEGHGFTDFPAPVAQQIRTDAAFTVGRLSVVERNDDVFFRKFVQRY